MLLGVLLRFRGLELELEARFMTPLSPNSCLRPPVLLLPSKFHVPGFNISSTFLLFFADEGYCNSINKII